MSELDEADEMEQALRRSARRRNIAIVVVLAAVVIAPFAKIFSDSHAITVANDAHEARRNADQARDDAFHHRALTAEEATTLRARGPKLHDEVVALREHWQRATERSALALVAPGSGRCPVEFQGPTTAAAESYVKSHSIDGNYFGSMRFDLVSPGELPPDPGFATWLTIADEIAARVAAGTLDRADLEAVRDLFHAQPKLFIIADSQRDAFITAHGYEAGSLTGHVYVYSFETSTIICAGDIRVENRSHIDITYYAMKDATFDQEAKRKDAARGVLERDLEMATRTAIAQNLRATR